MENPVSCNNIFVDFSGFTQKLVTRAGVQEVAFQKVYKLVLMTLTETFRTIPTSQ